MSYPRHSAQSASLHMARADTAGCRGLDEAAVSPTRHTLSFNNIVAACPKTLADCYTCPRGHRSPDITHTDVLMMMSESRYRSCQGTAAMRCMLGRSSRQRMHSAHAVHAVHAVRTCLERHGSSSLELWHAWHLLMACRAVLGLLLKCWHLRYRDLAALYQPRV